MLGTCACTASRDLQMHTTRGHFESARASLGLGFKTLPHLFEAVEGHLQHVFCLCRDIVPSSSRCNYRLPRWQVRCLMALFVSARRHRGRLLKRWWDHGGCAVVKSNQIIMIEYDIRVPMAAANAVVKLPKRSVRCSDGK
jgi:hypothetical protein